jgi:hypothetical protein
MPASLAALLPQMDIKNFSGEIAGIVKEELQNEVKKGTIKSPKGDLSQELKIILQDTKAKDKFLADYEKQFKSTFSIDALSTQVALKVDKDKLRSYVNDTFKKFSVSTGGEYVDKLIVPVMGSAIASFSKSAIHEFVNSKPDFDKLINTGLSYLAKQGVKVKELGEEQIRTEFHKIQGQLLSKNFKETLLNEVIAKANDLIKTNPATIVLSDVEGIKQKFINDFENVRSQAENAAKASFNELNNHIKELTHNELTVQSVLTHFKDDIAKRADVIKGIEKDIKRFADATDLVNLGNAQIEHAKAVAANIFQTSILNKYLKDGIGFIKSIDSFAAKAEQALSGDKILHDINDFKSKLTSLTTPTFSSVVSTISFASELTDRAEDVANIVNKLGMHGAAKSIGKFVGYAKAAIAVAGALLPPNPIGIIGAIGSLGGLFGGGSGPSIEEEMFQAMQDGFKEINGRLDEIQDSISNLTKAVEQSYKNIMQSLQIISNKLEIIKEQLNLTDQMINLIIYGDFNLAEAMLSTREDINETGLSFYDAWYNANADTSQRVLSTLNLYISSKDNLSTFIRQDFTNPLNNRQFELGINEKTAYDETKTLFKNIFTDFNDEEAIKNMLHIPSQKNQNTTFSNGINLVPVTKSFDFNNVTQNYFNPSFICKLTEDYFVLHPFFIINKKNTPFIPIDNREDLLKEETQKEIKVKLIQSIKRFSNLLEYIENSIVQQSILSGNLILLRVANIFYGNDALNYQAAIKAVDANELLQKNLAVLLIHLKIQAVDQFFDQYSSITNDPEKLRALNSLLVWGEGRLEFGYNTDNPANPLLCLYVLNEKKERVTRLLVPDLDIIQEQQMIYSDAMYSLLAAKQKVMTAIIDIQFFQGLPIAGSQSALYKEIFFLQS